MSRIVTKIGDVEVTHGVAEFLQNMLTYDIDRYIVDVRIKELSKVQDFLTRMLLDLEDPDPDVVKSCLATVLVVSNELSLLVKE